MTEQTTGKGRPTPKRRDAERRRGGPVAPPPTNRKEAAKQLRAKQAEKRQQVRKGIAAGDERALLPRDAGPIRRLARDLVDSRSNMGWLLLPGSCIALVASATKNAEIAQASMGVWTATLLAVALDLVLLGRLLGKRLRAEFPAEPKMGKHVRYGLMRSTTIRRFRMPKPQVERGQRV